MNAFCLADKNHVMLETSYGKFDTLMNYKKTKKVICQMLVASNSKLKSNLSPYIH